MKNLKQETYTFCKTDILLARIKQINYWTNNMFKDL